MGKRTVTLSMSMSTRGVAHEFYTRIGMIFILAGKLWYLRQMMLKCPIISLKNAKTHKEIPYNSSGTRISCQQ